jgi:hypothetical protein
MLNRVAAAKTLDDSHKKQLAMEIAALDQPSTAPSLLPTATARERDPVAPTSATAPPNTATTRPPAPHPTAPTTTAPVVSVTPTPTVKPAAPNVTERARQAALDGKPDVVRNLLLPKFRSGSLAGDDVRMLAAACKQLHDTACSDELKGH